MIKGILTSLSEVEKVSRQLDPGPKERDLLKEQVINHTDAFLDTLKQTKTKPFGAKCPVNGESDILMDSELDIFEESTPIEKLLKIFQGNVEETGYVYPHGGYMAYINPGGLYASALADFIADVVNPFSAVAIGSPGAVILEYTVVKWVGKQFGFSDGFGGTLTSGGSMSCLLAFAAARDQRGLKASEFHKAVIYITTFTHNCTLKVLSTISMTDCVKRMIPCDEKYHMQSDALEKAIEEDTKRGFIPFLIVATAGSTDFGSIDPLEEISTIAEKHSVWLHVDACYGGFYILSDLVKESLSGLNKADSVAFDPHKSLFIPHGCGGLIVKNKETLLKNFSNQIDDVPYLSEVLVDEISPWSLSFELTRPFRGAKVWLPLKLFGARPFRAALTEKVLLAHYLYSRLKEQEGVYELGPFPELSIVAFRFVKGVPPPDRDSFNHSLYEKLPIIGRSATSVTKIDGSFKIFALTRPRSTNFYQH